MSATTVASQSHDGDRGLLTSTTGMCMFSELYILYRLYGTVLCCAALHTAIFLIGCHTHYKIRRCLSGSSIDMLMLPAGLCEVMRARGDP